MGRFRGTGLRKTPRASKFYRSPAVAELIHELTDDDGADASCGDRTDQGEWYGLVRGPVGIGDLDVSKLPQGVLTVEEVEWLGSEGFIVYEDDKGKIAVWEYETEDELEDAWAECVDDCPESEESSEDEPEEGDPDDGDGPGKLSPRRRHAQREDRRRGYADRED